MRKLLAFLSVIACPLGALGNNGVMTNDAHQVIAKDNAMNFSGITVTGLAGGDVTAAGANTFTNTNKFTDPTKLFLVGASSAPDISGTFFTAGSNVEIVTGAAFAGTKTPFMIVGDYRIGSSGDRYLMTVQRDLSFFTNAAMDLNALDVGGSIGDSQFSLRVASDVPVATSFYTAIDYTGGGALIDGWGAGISPQAKVFSLNSAGTARFDNPYGTSGLGNYQIPQVILRVLDEKLLAIQTGIQHGASKND